MSDDDTSNQRPNAFRPLGGLGGRAVVFTLKPLRGAIGAAAGAGLGLQRRAVGRVLASDELERVVIVAVNLQRRAVDRVLDSEELERVLIAAVNSPHLQVALQRALASDGGTRLVDSLFDSGFLDRFVERLLTSESLWHMIDEIAASPAVTAAISAQSLGLADELGDQVRTRSRKADDWMERAGRRLMHRPPGPIAAGPDASP
jgi:hypothetical protein